MATHSRGYNETLFGMPTIPAGNFPHFKKPIPPDQKNKLLAMHRASKMNAGIYVAIVLAIYLILLTILLCRYSRKHRSQVEGRSIASICCGFQDDSKEFNPLTWVLDISKCCNKADLPKARNNVQEETEQVQPEAIELDTKVSLPSVPNQENFDDEIKPVEV